MDYLVLCVHQKSRAGHCIPRIAGRYQPLARLGTRIQSRNSPGSRYVSDVDPECIVIDLEKKNENVVIFISFIDARHLRTSFCRMGRTGDESSLKLLKKTKSHHNGLVGLGLGFSHK